MVNYNKFYIYKIYCKDNNIKDIYIGSTTNFRVRKSQHKNCCNNNKKNTKVYKFIRDHNGWSNWTMEIIEEVDCENKKELEKIERYYIEEFQSTLNVSIPTQTITEYRLNNKEKIKDRNKEYRTNNKQQIQEYQETYRYNRTKSETERLKCKKYQREYQLKNKEKQEQYFINYLKRNPNSICDVHIKLFGDRLYN
jgi:group I intron endonuclease